MTAERRLLIALTDIRALVLECGQCGVRLSIQPANVKPEDFKECPSCRIQWSHLDTVRRDGYASKLVTFADALDDAIKTQVPGDARSKVRVYLEIDEPKP